MQVKAQSLAESESAFEWLKGQIAVLPFAQRVGYEENHAKEFDVQFLLALLYSMNPTTAGAVSPPVKAYLSKRSVLDAYVNPTTREKFTALEGVVGEILDLYSYIEVTAAELWEPTTATPTLASAKKLGVAYKERLVPLPPKKAPEVILMHWAALISLSAFRQLLEVDSSTGKLSWTKPFSQVKKIWLEAAPTILEDLDKALSTNDRVINPVARAESVWVTVYRDVQAAVARQESAELAKRLAVVKA